VAVAALRDLQEQLAASQSTSEQLSAQLQDSEQRHSVAKQMEHQLRSEITELRALVVELRDSLKTAVKVWELR
jgi:CHASE3 domain sensor protein